MSADSGKQGKHLTQTDRARLLRLGQELNLSKKQIDRLEKLAMGSNFTATPKPVVQSEHNHNIEVGSKDYLMIESSGSQDINFQKDELILKKLVEANAPWSQIYTQASQMYQRQPSDLRAVKVVELTLIHGELNFVVEQTRYFLSCQPNFYEVFGEESRPWLILALWKKNAHDLLNKFLSSRDKKNKLTAVERFYLYWYAYRSNDFTRAWQLYLDSHQSMEHAAKDYGNQIGMNWGALILSLGKVASHFNYLSRAREFWEQIPKNDLVFDEARSLLFGAVVEKDKNGRSVYENELHGEADWKYRVKKIYGFLQDLRSHNGDPAVDRVALNDLFNNIWRWVPETPDSRIAIAKLIVASVDLKDELPGIMIPATKMAEDFSSASLEQGFWPPFLEIDSDNEIFDLYWQAVAKFHLYCIGAGSETDLWESHDVIYMASEKWDRPIPVSWKDLHRKGFRSVSRNPNLLELDRNRLLRQLQVAVDPKNLDNREIIQYLESCEKPSFQVLSRLEQVSASRHLYSVQVKILLAKSRFWNLTNDDLDKLFYVSASIQDHDLAWRVATVLDGRSILSEFLDAPWSVSGEKRFAYRLSNPLTNDIQKSVDDFPNHVGKVITSMITLGPLIPDLLMAVGQDIGSQRINMGREKTPAYKAEVHIRQVPWLKRGRKRFFSKNYQSLQSAIAIPPCVSVLPSNLWSEIVIRVCESLYLPLISWNISTLYKVFDQALLQSEGLMLKSRPKVSSKLGKWIRGLNYDQKRAWYFLSEEGERLSDDQFQQYVMQFIFRIATVMCPNHREALESLKTMRVNLDFYRDLEKWILAEGYSDIRKRLRMINLSSVPTQIQKTSSILQQRS